MSHIVPLSESGLEWVARLQTTRLCSTRNELALLFGSITLHNHLLLCSSKIQVSPLHDVDHGLHVSDGRLHLVDEGLLVRPEAVQLRQRSEEVVASVTAEDSGRKADHQDDQHLVQHVRTVLDYCCQRSVRKQLKTVFYGFIFVDGSRTLRKGF